MKFPILSGCLFAALLLPVCALAMSNEETARQLRLDRLVLPLFPSGMQARGIWEGDAIVACNYDEKGWPKDALVLSASREEFGEAAVEAVLDWKFIPSPGEQPALRRAMLVRFIFRKQGVSVTMSSPRIGTGKSLRAEVSHYTPISFDELDRVPRVVSQPPTTAVQKASAPGKVEVSFFVDESGRVRLPVVTDAASPELAEAAASTIAKWRFEAPRQQGRPVIAYQTMSLSFGPVTRS